mmetsp:Transcript_39259/g.101778  ORF Transcript_39259/g.101778 Transcript_39259/m.101778 type:complete len:356 (+) Transcript_39259:131-1198(+)|eukprot:jgi/Tetstr1/453648/TSEL_040604.t1
MIAQGAFAALLAVSLLVGDLSSASAGRALRQDADYDFEELPPWYGADAKVNISDGSTGNTVTQTFQFFANLPPAPPPPPYPGYQPRPPVDPRDHNPSCSDAGDKNFAYSLTANQLDSRQDDGGKFTVFVPPSHEVQAVLLVWLRAGVKDGFASVRGPGLIADVSVNRRNIMHTICGDWSHAKDGFYTYEFLELTDTKAHLLYFVRKSKAPVEPLRFDRPVDINMGLNNKFLDVDNANLEVLVEMEADWEKRVIYIDVENIITDRETLDTALSEYIQEGLNVIDEEANLYRSVGTNTAALSSTARTGEVLDAVTRTKPETDPAEDDYLDYEDYFDLAYEDSLADRFADAGNIEVNV